MFGGDKRRLLAPSLARFANVLTRARGALKYFSHSLCTSMRERGSIWPRSPIGLCNVSVWRVLFTRLVKRRKSDCAGEGDENVGGWERERAQTGRTACMLDLCVCARAVSVDSLRVCVCVSVCICGQGALQSEWSLSCCYLPSRPFREETKGCGGINRDLSSSISTNTTSSDGLRVFSVRALLRIMTWSCVHRC